MNLFHFQFYEWGKIMQLVSDENNQIYFWINSSGEIISPCFDYQEDAVQWINNWVKLAELSSSINDLRKS